MRITRPKTSSAVQPSYDPLEWRFRRWLCRFLLREIAFKTIARVDQVSGFENLPKQGPAILMMNHIAFVDPIVLVHTTPRDVVPLAKAEAYRYPIFGIFPYLWGAIPVQRDGLDREAVRAALQVLQAGELLLVAPEGTRNAALSEPRQGAAYLAARSGAPIVPVALEGTEGFPTAPFSSRWRQPGARVYYGPPFRVRPSFLRARGADLDRVAKEAMYALAAILPEHRRGSYADLSLASMETIEQAK